jgi:predicted nucleotidyltransferase
MESFSMFGLTELDLSVIREALSKYPAIREAVIFGSRAKGTERPGSDVDLALKGDDLGEVALEVSTFLNQESILPYFFDVLDYSTLDNADLLDHIGRVGKVIYPD